jgi:hypothetical protein
VQCDGTLGVTRASSTSTSTRMHVNFNFQVDPNGNQRPQQAFVAGGGRLYLAWTGADQDHHLNLARIP